MQDNQPPDSGEAAEETWRERARAFFESLGSLLSTRVEIFKQELGSKGRALGGAAVAFFLAAAFSFLALLLLTAGLAALLSQLFGSPVAGILATFVLFAGAAALAGYLGVKALSRGNLFEFPVTAEEIRKDWKVVTLAAAPEPPGPGGSVDTVNTAKQAEQSISDDIEARFRAGSE
jgi:ABC-type multidrug transport system fused ATPase/permease subunit